MSDFCNKLLKFLTRFNLFYIWTLSGIGELTNGYYLSGWVLNNSYTACRKERFPKIGQMEGRGRGREGRGEVGGEDGGRRGVKGAGESLPKATFWMGALVQHGNNLKYVTVNSTYCNGNTLKLNQFQDVLIMWCLRK